MKKIGRAMQFFALVLLPFGMFLELSGSLSDISFFGVNKMLIMMCFGIACFCLGRIVEAYSRQ